MIAGVVAFSPFVRVATGQAKSQWDGIYTKDQADRGGAVYFQSCASCHGDDLAGADKVPPLTGPAFLAKWNDHPLDELYERMRTTMPKDEPGILNFMQYADLLSFVLFQNKVPAGSTELTADTSVLHTIRLLAEKPAAR